MTTWGEIAKTIDKKYRKKTLEEIKLSENYIQQWLLKVPDKKTKKILDVGCGTGGYMCEMITMGFIAPRGLEIDKEATKIAKTHNLLVKREDMRSMSFDSKSFDIVTAYGSIEHVPETGKVLKEINWVLKQNGLFLFNVPYRWSFFVLAKHIQQAFGIWKCGYEKSFSKRTIIKLVNEYGFKVLEVNKMQIEISKTHPVLTGTLHYLDKIISIFGLGGHHIFLKCKKVNDK